MLAFVMTQVSLNSNSQVGSRFHSGQLMTKYSGSANPKPG